MFLKEELRGCYFGDMEEIREAVMSTMDTVTLEDYKGSSGSNLSTTKFALKLEDPTLRKS